MDFAEAKEIFLEMADNHELFWMRAKDMDNNGDECEGQTVETLYDEINMRGPQLSTPEWYKSEEDDDDSSRPPESCIAVLIFSEANYKKYIDIAMQGDAFRQLLAEEVFQKIEEES
jgi:hypothetical protein